MELMTSWEEKGYTRGMDHDLSQGLVQGKEQLIARLIRRRFGAMPQSIVDRIDILKPAQLDDLGEAILDRSSMTEVVEWLDWN